MAIIFKRIEVVQHDSPAQFLARVIRTLAKNPSAEVIHDAKRGVTESAAVKLMSDIRSLDGWDPEKYLIGMGQLWAEVMGKDKDGNEVPKTDPKTGQVEVAPVLVEVKRGKTKGTMVPAFSVWVSLAHMPETPETETATETTSEVPATA